MKYMSKEQIDRLKRFQRRFKRAETMGRPNMSPQRIQTAKQNNFMEETKETHGAKKEIDDTEMSFDDSAQLISQKRRGGRAENCYNFGDQKAQQYKPSVIVHNQPR